MTELRKKLSMADVVKPPEPKKVKRYVTGPFGYSGYFEYEDDYNGGHPSNTHLGMSEEDVCGFTPGDQ